MLKNIVIFTLLIIVTWQGYALYQLNSNSVSKLDSVTDSGATIVNKNNVESTPTIIDEVPKPQIPHCLMGLCPRFESMDITQGQTQSYTVIIQPTHITKGAGKVIVTAEGAGVLFESNIYAQVGVKPSPKNDGFYITYVVGDNYDVEKADKVTYSSNGKFIVAEDVKYPR